MAWTYSGNPNSSSIDATHYHLGDVNPADPLSTDEECAYALAHNGNNPLLAAADLAETKAAQFAMRPTQIRRGDRVTSYGDAAQGFRMLAQMLRQKASLASTTLYAGGLSVSEKDADRRDREVVPPFVGKDLHSPRRWPGVEGEEREP